MKTLSAALLASVSAVTYAHASTVTVDAIEAGGYTASYYNNPAVTSPEIHVIGIYEPNGGDTPGTAVVNINGYSGQPVDLVLSAFEPTQWVLQGAGVQNIQSVLINSYYASSVSGIDLSKVIDKSGAGWLGAYAYAWPATSGGSDTQALVSAVESIYGAPISTFTGAYGATAFTVSLSSVPEPGSLGLMAMGLIVVGGVCRARRTN